MQSRVVMTVCLVLAAASAPCAAGSWDLTRHPVARLILERAAGGLKGPCDEALRTEYSRIASAEEAETQWVAKDMRDGSCRVAFLGAGTATYVPNDREEVRRELAGAGAARMANVHTHPLTNSGYFAEGKSYAGQLMFVSQAALDARRVPADVLARQLAAVREGRIPGFNLSAPSVDDFLAAETTRDFAAQSPDGHETVSVVLTSAGAWTYSAKGKVFSGKVYDLSNYAQIFEAAYGPPPRGRLAGRREEIRRMWESQEEGLRAFAAAWGEAALELRAPYSAAATARLEAGDDSAVRAEFAKKLEQAGRFRDLLRTVGIEAEFTPFEAPRP